MKKAMLCLMSLLILTGCNHSTETVAESPIQDGSVYSQYAELWASVPTVSNYTKAIQVNYTFTYSNGDTQKYEMDAVFIADEDQDPIAQLSEHINSNGIQIGIEGIYQNNRLYNTYDQVYYYEDMSYAEVKQTLLVPIDAIQIDETDIDTIASKETENGINYLLQLKPESAKRIFLNRYDFNELSQYQLTCKEGTVTQQFDSLGNIIRETISFAVDVSVQNETVQVDYLAEIDTLHINESTVDLSRFNETAYVRYDEIDTDAISSADIKDDSAEATVTDTFKKRLVGRLAYEVLSDGVYQTTFNDSESYKIDFVNKQFVYTNHTSMYVYNWKGDTGGFGSSCNYNYRTEQGSDNCQESVLETLKDIKLYFEMELYYCGLSLSELQAEG